VGSRNHRRFVARQAWTVVYCTYCVAVVGQYRGRQGEPGCGLPPVETVPAEEENRAVPPRVSGHTNPTC
jgi:hypothetical protein